MRLTTTVCCDPQGLLVLYSIGILALSGDAKEQISSAYHDMTRTALQTIKEKGWVSSRAEEDAKRFTVTGVSQSFLLHDTLTFHAGRLFLFQLWISDADSDSMHSTLLQQSGVSGDAVPCSFCLCEQCRYG